MYGDAATAENDFGYGWHPRITGDHSHMPMFVAMAEGKVKGMFAMGQNPAVGGQNAGFQRGRWRKLDWLVVSDLFETETATFWNDAPEVKDGELKHRGHQDRGLPPPRGAGRRDGGQLHQHPAAVQWHDKAADPPGDCRSDIWFTFHLGLRLKELYADSTQPRDQGFLNLTWDYEPDPEDVANWRIKDEPSALKVLKEINGYDVADTASTCRASPTSRTTARPPAAPGSTPASTPSRTRTSSRPAATPDREGDAGRPPGLGLRLAGQPPHHLQPRLGPTRTAQPWTRAQEVGLVGPGQGRPDQKAGMWTGYDVPDFAVTKAPDAPAEPDGIGLDGLQRHRPVHHEGRRQGLALRADRPGRRPAADALRAVRVAGAEPALPEAAEQPGAASTGTSTATSWRRAGDPATRYVLSTYRLTEHHLCGTMSRWLPWLAELQPELFVEISPELAGEKGIANLDLVRVITPRGEITAKALVTRRMRPITIDGKTIHHVGLPWHWGYKGLVTGDVVNDLSLAGRRPERDHPRGQGVRVQRGEGVMAVQLRRPGRQPTGPESTSPRWPSDAAGASRGPMGFFTDTTLCIGCKACEVACKEWNQLPAIDGGVNTLSGD